MKKMKALKRKIKRNQRSIVQGFLITGVLIFIPLTVNSFTKPVEEEHTLTNYQERLQIIYDFEVYPIQSTLYPDPREPLPRDTPVIHQKLTDHIRMTITGIIQGDNLHPLAEEVEMLIPKVTVSTDTWEKNLDWEPKIILTQTREGTETLYHFEIKEKVPFQQATALVKTIDQEIGGRGREEYTLRFETKLHSSLSEEGQRESISGTFSFYSDERFLRFDQEVFFEGMVKKEEEQVLKNRVNLGGRDLDVQTARIVFPTFLGIFLLSGGGMVIQNQRQKIRSMKPRDRNLQRIEQKYGKRMVESLEVQALEKDRQLIPLKSFQDLLKISEEGEKPIIRGILKENSEEPPLIRFFILDEGSYYYFDI